MTSEPFQLSRREFVAGSLLAVAAASTSSVAVGREPEQPKQYRICAFEKFLQDLSYDDLADVIAELGFVGIEATVRKKGHVLPERVEDDLPKLVEALKKRDLEVTTMATDVLNATDLTNTKVLQAAKGLGIKTYRMGYYKYDLTKPILPQLDALRPVFKDLAAFNKELGVTALYHNHSGAKYVGASLWDIHSVIKNIPADQIGLAFDIRHATAEAGLSWPVTYDVVKPHIGTLLVKDFQWDGRKTKHVPLGTGRVNPKFVDMVKADKYEGPISLHVEYLKTEGTQANINALRRDLKVLRGWLSTS